MLFWKEHLKNKTKLLKIEKRYPNGQGFAGRRRFGVPKLEKKRGLYSRVSLICRSKRTNEKQAGKRLICFLRGSQFVFLYGKEKPLPSTSFPNQDFSPQYIILNVVNKYLMEDFQMTTKVWHKSTKMIIKAPFINQSINRQERTNRVLLALWRKYLW